MPRGVQSGFSTICRECRSYFHIYANLKAVISLSDAVICPHGWLLLSSIPLYASKSTDPSFGPNTLVWFSLGHQLPVCGRHVKHLIRVLSPPPNHWEMTRSPLFIVQSVIVQVPTQVCRGAAPLKTSVVITTPPEGHKANKTKSPTCVPVWALYKEGKQLFFSGGEEEVSHR